MSDEKFTPYNAGGVGVVPDSRVTGVGFVVALLSAAPLGMWGTIAPTLKAAGGAPAASSARTARRRSSSPRAMTHPSTLKQLFQYTADTDG